MKKETTSIRPVAVHKGKLVIPWEVYRKEDGYKKRVLIATWYEDRCEWVKSEV